MERLCERPDCSEPASVAYGMRPEDLVFWLDELRDPDAPHGVLCERHADSMTVPRNWTLDDLRDPDLHLFRPPRPAPAIRPKRRARPATTGSTKSTGSTTSTGFDQLELGEQLEPSDDVGDHAVDEPVETNGVAADHDDAAEAPDEWRPDFDTDDDLGGLLSARSPLLARAFRGADRER